MLSLSSAAILEKGPSSALGAFAFSLPPVFGVNSVLLCACSSLLSCALSSAVTGSSDSAGEIKTGVACCTGCSKSSIAADACSDKENLNSVTTERASSLTAPLSIACDRDLCCFKMQFFAWANETGNNAGGGSVEVLGRSNSSLHRSLYNFRSSCTFGDVLPVSGIAHHSPSQIASIALLKSGGTHTLHEVVERYDDVEVWLQAVARFSSHMCWSWC